MEEFATIQHSLNNENSFDEERVKNFLLSLISDSRFHHLTFRIPFFKIKILRRGNRIRRFHHRSIFHKFSRERFSGMSWQIHPKEGGKKKTIDLLRQSKTARQQASFRGKSYVSRMEKRWKKVAVAKKKYILLEKFLSNGRWSRSTTPYSMKENGFRRLTVDDSRQTSRRTTLGKQVHRSVQHGVC